MGMEYDESWQTAGPLVLLACYLFIGLGVCTYVLMRARPRWAPGTKRVDADETVDKEVVIIATPAQSMDMSFTRSTLAFRDIYYSITDVTTGKSTYLLSNVHGVAQPGTLTALMGASGAGKTTLLDVLADRKTTGELTGFRAVNAVPVSSSTFSRMSAYCEQEDVHLPTSTVKEAIEFSAQLRLSADVSIVQRRSFVNWILQELELYASADRLVSSLAPGERKRLTIGVELAANTPILFLDEPTTGIYIPSQLHAMNNGPPRAFCIAGLDSRSASAIMRVLKRLANSGRTIIATIHQPSASVFFGFSHLILLAPGGTELYHGPMGQHAQNVIAVLSSLPGVQPLQQHVNPATWMLAQTYLVANTPGLSPSLTVSLRNMDHTSPISSSNSFGATQIAWTSKKQLSRPRSTFELLSLPPEESAVMTQNPMAAPVASAQLPVLLSAPWTIKLYLILRRAQLHLWRDAVLQPLRMVVFTIVALFFGVTFYNVSCAIPRP
jgi:ABC-type multidrug transport system ATPase subunit